MAKDEIRVSMSPHPDDVSDNPNSGIAQVIVNWAEKLKEHGIRVVPKDHPAQVSIGHAAANPLADIHVSHGLLWTGEFELGQYGYDINEALVRAARNAREIITPSEWVADVYRRDMHVNPRVIRHGVNVDLWRRRPHKGYVLYTKNRESDGLNPSALNMLAREMPSVTFMTTFATRESPPNVKTLGGAVPHDEMKQRIEEAAAVLMLDRETWGIAAAEALAAGVPVITTDRGAVKDFVVHGETGYVYKDRALLDVIQGINFCLEHRDVLSANAWIYAEKHLTWDDPIEQVANTIRDVLWHKTHDQPTISVVITSHNYGDRVGKAISSVFDQSHKDIEEVFVIDDSSDEGDKTPEVVESFDSKPGPHVHYERTEFGNVALARNHGIAQSRSKYVVSLDGDDWIERDWIKDTLALLEEDPTAGFAYSGVKVLVRDGTIAVPKQLVDQVPGSQPGRDFPTEDHDKQFIPGVPNQYPGSAVMFRREALKRTGGYRFRYAPDGAGSEDAELYLRLLSIGYHGRMADPTPSNLWVHTDGEGVVSSQYDYEEVDWHYWHPWTRDWKFPFAAVATPKNKSHPVHSYEPQVSVIIPVGPAHETLLSRALDSIEAQEFRNWEVIVVWDYMPGQHTLNWYQQAYPFVRWEFSAGTGPGRARNIGVYKAQADYITFLDADDYYSPTFLSYVTPELSAREDVIVYSEYYGRMTHEQFEEFGGNIVKDEGKHFIVSYSFRDYDPKRAFERPGGDRPYVWTGVNILLPKAWHREVGGFREDMASWEDCLYLYRLAWAGYNFKRIERPLWVYNFMEGRRREASRGSEPGLMVLLQEEYDRLVAKQYVGVKV